MPNNKIRRFLIFRIIEHWLHIIVLSILLITGFIQKFYNIKIFLWILLQLGGVDNVRLIHRYFAIVLILSFFLHIIIALNGALFLKWNFSMFIKKSDFTNFIHDFKYYMGIINEPAKCDRYTYNQKFEYWGVFISIIIMLSSGLVLWFPIFVTQFLPGEIIAAAKIIHTNQAIIVFIITLWHIYNAMFNPAVIPLDKSIFTGYITEDRFLKEHPIEYEKKNLIR